MILETVYFGHKRSHTKVVCIYNKKVESQIRSNKDCATHSRVELRFYPKFAL